MRSFLSHQRGIFGCPFLLHHLCLEHCDQKVIVRIFEYGKFFISSYPDLTNIIFGFLLYFES